jgi:putative transposase
MPRRARIMLAGIPVHVRQRGHNGNACFISDEDRAFYLFHLGRNLARFGCALHAYCLMGNHVHLVLTPARRESCALLMKQVGQLYSQYFNKLYERRGSLWEGRFRSSLVQTEDYLLSLHAYVELNAVRAGMVRHPNHYAWSSYGENATGAFSSGLLTPHEEYLRYGAASYVDLVRSLPQQRVKEIRSAIDGCYALGNEAFRRSMAQTLGRRVEQGKPGRPATPQGKRGPSLI